ncbi:MAG: PP2C family protein-serine/threonine phosphatase [Clostridia bacterium]|nr:PP2C family protein-serine/threonine phosphatase [Clostridia bacterium]
MFTMSTVNLINALFIAASIGVCGLCLMQISSSIHIRKDVRRYFQVFFISLQLYICLHLARQLMEGFAGNGVKIAQYIVTSLEIATAGFMSFMMSVLVGATTLPDKSKKKAGQTFLALFFAHVILFAIGEAFGLIFYFDESNFYHRAGGYLLSNLFPVIMLIINIVLLVKYRSNVSRRLKAALWNYMIAPLVAVAVQSAFYGLQLLIFATVGAAIYMFGVIVQGQNERYEEQRAENSRIESELNLASNIQADMLPNIYPAFPDRKEFDIYATMEPAKEVGGDFYDFFLIDDDHLCMVMADVSGKGVPAALFMMASKIILANNAMIGKSPAQILTDTNAAICSHNREEMFVTVWLGILEISTGKLTAANAGHEYPVLKKANGEFELVKDKHGFVIGGMNGIKYKEYELTMEPGAKLFLYTDGVPEATSAENELFGIDRMLKALNENKDETPENLLKGVRSAVDEFVNGAEQFDDITMLNLEYKGEIK